MLQSFAEISNKKTSFSLYRDCATGWTIGKQILDSPRIQRCDASLYGSVHTGSGS
jgi:hypothetical protein